VQDEAVVDVALELMILLLLYPYEAVLVAKVRMLQVF
jgi:hypothetical protein